MPDPIDISQGGLAKANENRAKFSGHGRARGAAGFLDPKTQGSAIDHLGARGDSLSVTPPKGGFGAITVAASWDTQVKDVGSKIGKLLGLKAKGDIDLDLGCLYELHDGHRGAVQCFGKLHGNFNDKPYLSLSEDEQTGDKQGDDEWIRINGAKWSEIKRLLVYVYIYEGASNWGEFQPQIQIRIPNEKPMVVTIGSPNDDMDICAVAGIENVRNGIKLTNYTEYFPGQAEMDRAFGFGIEWDEGKK
ncbi:MAG: Tellurium resistance protein TerA [Micavibrio aeruginosavorus]|uniref:Tellurium resistance protein TerA n=1 Tax=Micavibrio aeruginosavorus TaxID=349221 RepID=A0A2W5FLH6_9BACT|nr:MAG: Tellurium resistance protein TerA [Micavibrio aeruginosavorus]